MEKQRKGGEKIYFFFRGEMKRSDTSNNYNRLIIGVFGILAKLSL